MNARQRQERVRLRDALMAVMAECEIALEETSMPPNGYREGPNEARGVPELDARERETLDLICQGFTNAEIASQIHWAKKTVEVLRAKLCAKFGAKNTALLVRYAIKVGAIEP